MKKILILLIFLAFIPISSSSINLIVQSDNNKTITATYLSNYTSTSFNSSESTNLNYDNLLINVQTDTNLSMSHLWSNLTKAQTSYIFVFVFGFGFLLLYYALIVIKRFIK